MMKAEFSSSSIAAIVLVLIVVGAGYFFTDGFKKLGFGAQIVNGCQSPTDSANNLLVPLMGYYQCEPAIGGQITDTVAIDTGQTNTYKVCTINTPSCILTKPSGFLAPFYYCDVSEVDTDWLGQKKCKDGTANLFPPSLTINSNGKYATMFIPSNFPLVGIQTQLQRTYTLYTLFQYSPTSGRNQVYQTANAQCSPPGSEKLCVGDTTGQYCTKNLYHGSLTFNENSNYFDKLVIGPLKANTYTYNGQTVYGSGVGTLYSIGKVTLSDGTCYSVPQSVVANVACLPGAISGGQQCGTDFTWHTINPDTGSNPPSSACIGDFQCPGQGNYIPDFSDTQRKTAVVYSCISGQCVLKNKVVSDCANSNACLAGTTCFLDPATGKGRCLQPGQNPLPGRVTGVICPDGTLVDNTSKCQINGLPWSIILALIGGALSFLIVGGKGIRERDEVDIAIGAIIGTVAAIGIWWFVENFVTIAVFGALIAILGGAALYFFGGAILMVFIVLATIIRTVRGD